LAKKKASEITGNGSVPLFRQRMQTQEIKFKGHDGVFHVQALPATVQAMIQSRGMTTTEAAIEYVRFGLVKVVGLKDENGGAVTLRPETERVGAREFHVAPYEFIDSLPVAAISALCVAIANLTNFGELEQERLDFTTASN